MRKRDHSAVTPPPGGPPTIEGYADLTVIGRGASSTVYRAHQEGYDRLVAVKVLNIDVSDRKAQRRFVRERSLNGRLSNHPNVVTVLDSGFVDGRHPYLTMEHYEPGSLSDRLTRRGPFDVALALHIGIRIAGALETAHRIGVLHRDVKPQNVLLSAYGEPALADFGIATILEMEQSLTAGLTPVHAAPELLEGADPSVAADVYALGSTIFTVLAGAAPFAGPPGEGVLAQLLRITTSDLPSMPRADVPASLIEALRASMAKRPAERTATAADFGAALRSIQTELGLSVTALPVEDIGEPIAAVATPAAPSMPPPIDDTIDAVGAGPAMPAVAATAEHRPAAPPAPTATTAPIANPAPAFTAAAEIDEPTIGRPVDEPTIAGRPLSARRLPEVDVDERRRWPLVVAGVAVVAIAGTTIAVLRGGDEAAAPPPSTTTIATESSAAVTETTGIGDDDIAAFVPTGVSASIDSGQVLLTWTDQTGGDAPHLVEIKRSDDAPAMLEPVMTGQASYVVPGMDPSTSACFRIKAVLSIGGPEAVTADSEWVCINAVAVTTTAG